MVVYENKQYAKHTESLTAWLQIRKSPFSCPIHQNLSSCHILILMSTFYTDYIIFSDSEVIHIQLPYDNIHGLTENINKAVHTSSQCPG